MELKFRTLRADEIEVRIGQNNKEKTAFSLLLYKTARTDAEVLDETVGAWNWQKKFYQVKNTMVCSVGIYNEERKEWIWKDDGGDDQTEMEQVKAELSDSFKRASGGSSWGIGRELYYAPKIWVDATNENTNRSYYSVKEIEYNDKREIVKLTIINANTKQIVYSYQKGIKVSQNVPKEPKTSVNDFIDNSLQHEDTITQEDLNTIEAYLLTIKGNDMKTYAFNEYLINTFNVYSAKNLNFADGRKVAEFCRKKLANGK